MESKETRRLSVILNSEEARAKGLELAEKVVKLEDAKLALKGIQKRMKDDMEKLEKEIALISQVVKSGKEDREVECFEVRNNTLMTIETYRTDTGEMVATRPMTANERQLTMFPKLKGIEGGKGDEKAPETQENPIAVNEGPVAPPENIVTEKQPAGDGAPIAILEIEPTTPEVESVVITQEAAPAERDKSNEQGATTEAEAPKE